MTAIRTTAPRTTIRRRRLLAVLAAAGVLGVGASVTTLAAWNEPQAVHGGNGSGAPIGTSSFCVEESLDGTTFATVSLTGAGNELPFSPTLSTVLSPGDAVYAWVALATCPSSRPATVSLSAASFPVASALSSLLTYGVRTGVSQASCTAASFAAAGTSLVPSGTAVLTPSATTFGLPATGAAALPSTTAVGVCFQLGLPLTATTAAQGQTGTPVWTFNAVSN